MVGYGYVNDCGGLYTQSDVGNKISNKIKAKLIKRELKQRIIKRAQYNEVEHSVSRSKYAG